MDLINFTNVLLQFLDVLSWPSFALVYPLCVSIWAIENGTEFSYRQCLKYWVLFYIISILESMIPEVLLWLPFWPYAKGTASLLLAVPYFQGASFVYLHYLRPYIIDDPRECHSLHISSKNGDRLTKQDDIFNEIGGGIKEHEQDVLEKEFISEDDEFTPYALKSGTAVRVQRDWSCGLSLLSASGDKHLREHLSEKKRMSKQEDLRCFELMTSETVNSTRSMRSNGMVLVDSLNQVTRTNIERLSGLISPVTRLNKGCRWTKPEFGWTKLNTDGSIDRGNATFGGLLRDYQGDPICAYVSKAFTNDIFLAELWAVWRGLVLANGLGIEIVWVESDSLSVVKTINKEQQYSPKADKYLKNIWKLLKKFKKCKISHSWRESNRAADHLSRMSVLENDMVLWPADFPKSLHKIIEDDAQGKWYRRLTLRRERPRS